MKIVLLIVFSCFLNSMVAQPDNDACVNAILIPAERWCSEIRAYTIFDATPSITEGQTCTGEENSLMKDIWFEFTALGNFVFFGITALEVPVPSQPRRFTITMYRGGCTQKLLDRCVLGNVDVHWIIGDDFIPGETYLVRVATSIDSLRPEDTSMDFRGNFGVCLDSYDESNICNDLSVNAFGDTLLDLGNSSRLSASAKTDSIFVNYQWYIGDRLICDNCPELEVYPDTTTLYTVRADDGLCIGQDQIEVNIRMGVTDRKVFIPNAFTPNGDLLNDRATIYGGPSVASIQLLHIYNRWGQSVFRQYNFPPNNNSTGWDGTQKGEPAPPGVYTYVSQVEFNDGSIQQYSGAFHLIR